MRDFKHWKDIALVLFVFLILLVVIVKHATAEPWSVYWDREWRTPSSPPPVNEIAECQVSVNGMTALQFSCYDGFVDRMRDADSRHIPLSYLCVHGVQQSWAEVENVYWRTLYDRLYPEYILRDIHGEMVYCQQYDLWLTNPTIPGFADIIADVVADAVRDGPWDRDFTGFMLDWWDWSYPDWPCRPSWECTDHIDMNGDGVPYGDDWREWELYRQAGIELMRTLRERFTELRGRESLVLVLNGTLAFRAPEFPPGLIDGQVIEDLSYYIRDERDFIHLFSSFADVIDGPLQRDLIMISSKEEPTVEMAEFLQVLGCLMNTTVYREAHYPPLPEVEPLDLGEPTSDLMVLRDHGVVYRWYGPTMVWMQYTDTLPWRYYVVQKGARSPVRSGG